MHIEPKSYKFKLLKKLVVQHVKEHNMHIESKSYKFKLLRKLVVQYDIEVWFGRRSCVRHSHLSVICIFDFPFVLLSSNLHFFTYVSLTSICSS